MPDPLALTLMAANVAVLVDGARGPVVEMAVLAPTQNADARPRGRKQAPSSN